MPVLRDAAQPRDQGVVGGDLSEPAVGGPEGQGLRAGPGGGVIGF